MFGIGPLELVFIFVVALLVFGPKKLPELARTVGKGLAEFRRASGDLRRSMDFEIDSKTFQDTPGPAQAGSPHVPPEPGSALEQLETAIPTADADLSVEPDAGHAEYEPEPVASSVESRKPHRGPDVDVQIDVETTSERQRPDQVNIAPLPPPRPPGAAAPQPESPGEPDETEEKGG